MRGATRRARQGGRRPPPAPSGRFSFDPPIPDVVVGALQVRPRPVRGLEPSPEGEEDQLLGGGAGGPRTSRPWTVATDGDATVEITGTIVTRARDDTRAPVTEAQPIIVAQAEPTLWSHPGAGWVKIETVPALAG